MLHLPLISSVLAVVFIFFYPSCYHTPCLSFQQRRAFRLGSSLQYHRILSFRAGTCSSSSGNVSRCGHLPTSGRPAFTYSIPSPLGSPLLSSLHYSSGRFAVLSPAELSVGLGQGKSSRGAATHHRGFALFAEAVHVGEQLEGRGLRAEEGILWGEEPQITSQWSEFPWEWKGLEKSERAQPIEKPAEEEEEEEEGEEEAEEEEGEEEVSDEEKRRTARTMAWRCTGKNNMELLNNLRAAHIIQSNEVYEAMKKVDRGNYVDHSAYADSPQPIGYNATISAPHMHAHALEFLRDHLKEGMKALDVGSGSGYLAVCMANMVGVRANKGLVVGIDYIKELVDMSVENVKHEDADLLDNPNHFKLITGDGWKGVPEFGPYNAIHVGAAAVEIPKALVDQLVPGGKMVVPVGQFGGQSMMAVSKDEAGVVHTEHLLGVSYVPLVRVE
eukprot:GHVS01042453.1.p1 GENE.GHVS01042453.1~~GHVS01042453.1.p1  ORF type:complete len:443 (+),score=87.15 GHVS01042453.1:76-1404(+)